MRSLTIALVVTLLCTPELGWTKPRPDEPGAVAPSAAPQAALPSEKTAPRTAASASGEQVFRFDALRIEGLAGPNALVLRQLAEGKRRSLLRRRRSFVHRIFATLEASAGPSTPRGR